jgi:hypothetical protein
VGEFKPHFLLRLGLYSIFILADKTTDHQVDITVAEMVRPVLEGRYHSGVEGPRILE